MQQLTTSNISALAIAFARHEVGMSQQDLATAMGGKDKQRISNIESGKENLSAEYLDKLINALGITHHRFLELQIEAADIIIQNQQQFQIPHN